MNITMPWGKEKITVEVPDTWNVIFPKERGKTKKQKGTESAIVKKSIQEPVETCPLDKMKLRGKKILIVVDDNTRPTPAHKFFHVILEALEKAGASLKKVTVIPALGIHTQMLEEEMAEKIGAKNLKKVKWQNHDAFDEGQNRFFGNTSRGTPVYLNRAIGDADLVISIGVVEPHLWAGFGGGMKNILPGVASADTIGTHHSIIAEPPYRFNRVGMEASENSFRQDLEEIRGMIQAEIFCVNVILDHKKDIIASFAGDPIKCHRAAIEFDKNHAGVILEKQVDGIICNSNPMDINFKQSMKCVGNSLPAVKPGGTVMAFMKAERGLDDIPMPEDSKPLWLVKTILRLLGPARVLGFLEKVKPGLDVEQKFLTYYSMQLIRAHELCFYVPTLTNEEVKALGFFESFNDPQKVIDRGVKKLGKKATVAVFPNGGVTFPIVG